MLALAGCVGAPDGADGDAPSAALADLVISGGTIYDGTGREAFVGDVAITDGRIVSVGPEATGRRTVDATGLAVAPGFINTHSWATESLIEDPRGMSDLKQGVTTEVFGEGWSMGPLTADMRASERRAQADIKFDIPWTTLGDYLTHMEERGTGLNVASFVGASTVRMHVLGEDDVNPDAAQLQEMQALVRQAMNEGALGVGSALIYAPGNYADTAELTALASAAAACDGRYISHIRSEGSGILPALDELIAISRGSGAPGIVYHLKQSGRSNWDKQAAVLERIEEARASGLDISATMYNYPASSTGLEAAMPLWVQEGGDEAWIARLQEPGVRERVAEEMRDPAGFAEGDNRLIEAGGGKGVLLVNFRNPDLRHLQGKTLEEVAAMRRQPVEETAIDLVVEDKSRVGVVYFLMSEENVTRQVSLPWMSFGSDAGAPATEPPFTNTGTHPRAYGNIARLLGKYVREEQALPLTQAVHQLTGFAARQMGFSDRGTLTPGLAADVTIFDPQTIGDRATFATPHQYSVGVRDVFVNGTAVLRGGEPTGETPGQFVKGAGAGRCPA
ncbi:N-acyl-D-amino-acid deacylase [Pacificimonas flava]|uniref:N-acyl-D-amino-acid deacylase n=1 Tax=Pacificimonas flava TaxID=1234595 RepID=M2SCN7_9SPHN|nr:N-acyl-D-amino-acid deacylase [Pacificimonas flava]